jgi:pyruvate kinase
VKKTKIICTVGPSTDNADIIEKMLSEGMNIARFNFSHGSHGEHAKRIGLVREASEKTGKVVALLLDTKGPEMRLGKFTEGKVRLVAGQQFILTTRDVLGTQEISSVSHKLLPTEITPGNTVLLADGLISLHVNEIVEQDIITTVENSGEIGNLKRVAVPGVRLDLPFLSSADVADIVFGIEQNMDIIAASFVQRATDILAIRKLLEQANAAMEIVAKIENAEGVRNIDEILKVADGIMVARGDLGVEIPAEEVPVIQKMLIEKCNKAGKPVITATQMLESMITNPRPTRAEASDIANAIFDGTDAIMLSGETASGQYPVEAVKTMATIALRTEAAIDYTKMLLQKGVLTQCTTTEAISHATVHVAHELGADAIITATESGYTARMVSKYRPKAAIIAVTPSPKAVRRMQLQWGVFPVLGRSTHSTDEMVESSVLSALSAGKVKNGDLLVITAGVPVGTTGTTNMIKVHTVGNVLLRGRGIGQKSVTGEVCIIKNIAKGMQKFKAGDILVVPTVAEEIVPYALQASAIIAEEGGLTSSAAIIGVSYGIPVIVGVDGATVRLTDNEVITVDAARGLVYQGEINSK